MFNFLKNLFRPKNTEGPHPLDGPVRAAIEKASLPEPPAPAVTPVFVPPVEPKPVVQETVVHYQSEPAAPAANSTHWPFPTTKPEPAVETKKEKKPRKPRAPKVVAMSTQSKKKK